MPIPKEELLGSVLQIPDRWWGFEAVGRADHPGVCVGFSGNFYKAKMVKGTDTKSARYNQVVVIIDDDESNGLKKPTAFAIKPECYSVRRLQLLEDRRIGRLTPADLQRLQAELIRLFGEAGAPHA
jgi:hypothetical protein